MTVLVSQVNRLRKIKPDAVQVCAGRSSFQPLMFTVHLTIEIYNLGLTMQDQAGRSAGPRAGRAALGY